jgi:DNA-binding protein HU-beta
MQKSELINQVGERIGDKKAAAVAVDAILDAITTAVANGEKVTLPGFGIWERVQRPARDARNPATGGVVHVPATNVPKFRAAEGFKTPVKARA